MDDLDEALNTVEKAIFRRQEEIRRLCSECKTPEESSTVHGYTCQYHYMFFTGKEMPTLREISASEICNSWNQCTFPLGHDGDHSFER